MDADNPILLTNHFPSKLINMPSTTTSLADQTLGMCSCMELNIVIGEPGTSEVGKVLCIHGASKGP